LIVAKAKIVVSNYFTLYESYCNGQGIPVPTPDHAELLVVAFMVQISNVVDKLVVKADKD